MQLADFKCLKCGQLQEDLPIGGTYNCSCGNTMKRVFGFLKPPEFIPGYYENFEDKPIYIESKEEFKREAKKRNLEQVH